ncbi:MAG: hypothetical protein A2W91_15145 [Bacteroidetes bacterium GWF2_38_335]|nr:MAG: hypothetical protein A2W91_15145 [Bacteroidetes bacterium GWF2_38_335]OFY81084.1 MAG: hypothetical protein A2281_13335 [Bacteroidetes bacterium RIFOXYA12_FULL_38_20]HBS87597.1 hypothetical protein [Bacteroidales bacterium]
MKLPIGKIKKDKIDEIFVESIKYHIDTFYTTLSEYEPLHLYSHWRSIVRSIDEIINIPMELDDISEINLFLDLDFNFYDSNNLPKLKVVLDILEKRFEKNVAIRFQQLAMMCMAIDSSYEPQGIFNYLGNELRLNNTKNTITYLQSRRAYYVTTLGLIPKIAKGKKVIEYIDTLNFLQYPMDSCLVNITTAYYNLLLNHSLPDFEMDSDGTIAKRNFEYNNLEGFFIEPERLSLLDQMELRPDIIVQKQMLSKAQNKLFSFSEVANAMALFEGAFDKYKIQDNIEYKELTSLFNEIAIYLKDDFHIIIEEDAFTAIARKYKSLTLHFSSDDYFKNLNNYYPFQKVNGIYFTTVVLLTRFVYRTLSQSLLKNRTFQIHSGFIFEDKVSKILEGKGYLPTGITRINQKEFDLITIKDNKVFNFQCKNNFIDISRVNYDFKKIGRFNNRLCRYYENAIIKEEKRENLIKSKTGINDIEHFVISRFPVITRNVRIINLVDLKNWQNK